MKSFLTHICVLLLLTDTASALGNTLNQTKFKNHQRISETEQYEKSLKYAKYFQPETDKPKKDPHKITEVQSTRGEPDLNTKIKTNEDGLRTQKVVKEKREQYILMCLLALFTGILFVVIVALTVYCFKRTKVSAQEQQYRQSLGRDN